MYWAIKGNRPNLDVRAFAFGMMNFALLKKKNKTKTRKKLLYFKLLLCVVM